MPRPLFRSFAGGEVTPEAYGRVDLEKLQTGLATCKNFIVLPHGPAQNRPGFEYVLETKYSFQKSILIPFVYNADQAYALEFGHEYMRVHLEGGTVLEPAQAIVSVDQGNDTLEITAHGWSDGDWVFVDGMVGMTELNGRFFIVTSSAVDTVMLLNLDGSAVDFAAFGAYVSDGTVARVYELATPYQEADLSSLHYAQSTDVLTLVHPDYQQRELVRAGATSWSLNTIDFDPDQIAPTGVVATATVGSGTTQYAYTITALASGTLEESFAATPDDCYNNLTVAGNYNTITWSSAAGAVRYNVYKLANGLFGYIGQASGTSFIDDNITPDVGTTPPEGADPFTSAANYPAAVGYFEGRRWFAGTAAAPQGLWATRSGAESTMTSSIPVRDDDAISVRLRSQRADAIRHILPLSELLLLTSGGEWRITAQNSDALTPTTISYRTVGAVGASDVQPCIANGSVLYNQAMGGRINEMLYSWESQGFKSADISILASHLFDGFSITSLAYTRSPYSILWAARDDGILLGCTYIPEHKVIGWHHHETDGAFEAVASIPEPPQDRLYAVIRRKINGRTVRYVERMGVHAWGSAAYFVDAGSSYGDGTSEGVDCVLKPSVAWAYTTTGGTPVVTLRDATITNIWDPLGDLATALLPHSLAGTINQIAIYSLDGTAPARSAYLLVPGTPGAFGDPMSLFRMDEDGTLTLEASGLSYNSYMYGPNTYAGMVAVWHYSLIGVPQVLRLFLSDYNPPTAANILAAEVIGLTTGVLQAVYTGDNILGQVAENEPLLAPMFTCGASTVATVSGLWHLEGETVSILADGAVVTPQVVTNGAITLPTPASTVRIGLPIDAILQTLPAAIEGPAYGFGMVKNINSAYLRVQETSGIEVGPSLDALHEYQQRTTEPYGTPPGAMSKVIEVPIDPSWNYDGTVYVKQAHPLPATILAVALDLTF